MENTVQLYVVLVVGWTIEMYLNGAYAPSIVTGKRWVIMSEKIPIKVTYKCTSKFL